jgi:hypothetical protein
VQRANGRKLVGPATDALEKRVPRVLDRLDAVVGEEDDRVEDHHPRDGGAGSATAEHVPPSAAAELEELGGHSEYPFSSS